MSGTDAAGRSGYHRQVLAETDLALINALQVAPRAEWSDVGRALGISPSTAARRWEALAGAGVAWVTCAPGPRFLGRTMFVSLRAAQGTHAALCERLCAEPAAATVSMVTGPFDFLVDCFAADAEELNELAIGTFAAMPEVARSEASLAVGIYRTGSDYRSGVLDPAALRMIGDAGAGGTSGSWRPDPVDAMLLHGLSLDGRVSWAELGESCAVSPQTARRRVQRMLAANHVALRCEYALTARGPLYEVNLQLDVPAKALVQAASYFGRLKECRLSSQVISAHNLNVTLWIRDLHEVNRHELELAELLPGTRVLGRDVSVRTVKRLGHVLDHSGRSTAFIPPSVWTPAQLADSGI